MVRMGKKKVESIAAKSSTNILDLPEEMLRLIFRFLLDHDLKSTLPVCKIFCSVSIHMLRRLTIKDPKDTLRALQRSPTAREINIHCPERVFDVLRVISRFSSSSSLLEKLLVCLPKYYKSVKFLQPCTIGIIRSIKTLKLTFDDDDYDLSHLADPPWWGLRQTDEGQHCKVIRLHHRLTALGIDPNTYREWYDYGVHKITNILPKLRKIDLSHHNGWITDKTLAILSSNCPYLQSVNFRGCTFSAEALCKFLRNSLRVTSIDMPVCKSVVSRVVECRNAVKHLNHISLEGATVCNQVLIALAESQPPLKSIIIGGPSTSRGYTMDGLFQLLTVYPGLVLLSVHLPYSNNRNNDDRKLSLIVKGLSCLRHIRVVSRVVCLDTLFSLVQNCPLLETVWLKRLDHTSEKQQRRRLKKKKKSCGTSLIEKNYSIRTIEISPEADIWLRKEVGIYCPKLEKGK